MSNNQCVQCPEGTYSVILPTVEYCQSCPSYMSPAPAGSTSINDCACEMDICLRIQGKRVLYMPQYCPRNCPAGTSCCPIDLKRPELGGVCVSDYINPQRPPQCKLHNTSLCYVQPG